MAWTALPTFAVGQMLTAAQMNILVGNLNETAPAKATQSGSHFAGAGVNQIVERIPTTGVLIPTDTTTNGSYVNLSTPGPDVIVTTGPQALILLAACMSNNTVNAETFYSYACSNATTIAADDDFALRFTSSTANALMASSFAYLVSLSPGQNEFRARYRVSAGTGSWQDRRLSVVPF